MTQRISRDRSDRWADWAVIAALAVALLLGTAVMTLAQGQRSRADVAAAGLAVHYPQEWLLRPAEGLAFQAIAPESGAFKTTYQARVIPIAASEPATVTLSLALNNLALTRGRQETAYRLFEIVEGQRRGQAPTLEAHYVYVAEGSDLFAQQMPAVVQGLDVAVAQGGRAYIFSLLAAADAFSSAEGPFRRFVESAEIK
jgi:hypothetical protein